MIKALYNEATYNFRLKSEEREKINDFFKEMTGLDGIREICIKPDMMEIKTIRVTKVGEDD